MFKKLYRVAIALPAALMVFMLISTPAMAAEFRGEDNIVISSGDVINDDLYLGGNRIIINGTVNGDVMAAGNSITINGVVNGNLMALGTNIDISGEVTGDVRTAGSDVQVSGTIGGDLLIAGSTINIQDTSSIGRDLVFGAENIKVSAPVVSDILGASSRATMNSVVDGNARLYVDRLTISSTAVIKGNLTYTSNNNADIETGSQINGAISHLLPDKNDARYHWGLSPAFKFWSKVISYLMALLIGILIVLVAPAKSAEVADNIRKKSLPSLGWGALIFIVAPIAMVVALLTIIGIPLSLLAMFIYLLLIFLSQLVVGLFIGRLILERANVRESRGTIIGALALGFGILTLLKLIPYVGFIFWWATVFFGFGAIAVSLFRKKQNVVVAEAVETNPNQQ